MHGQGRTIPVTHITHKGGELVNNRDLNPVGVG